MEIFVDLTDFEDCDIIQVPSLENPMQYNIAKKIDISSPVTIIKKNPACIWKTCM